MKNRDALIRSTIVALVIGLLFPAMWLAFTGTSYRTPVIEKGSLDHLSKSEFRQWVAKNQRGATFVEHISGLPRLIKQSWVGYLQTSLGIFIVIFVLNAAYLLGGRK